MQQLRALSLHSARHVIGGSSPKRALSLDLNRQLHWSAFLAAQASRHFSIAQVPEEEQHLDYHCSDVVVYCLRPR